MGSPTAAGAPNGGGQGGAVQGGVDPVKFNVSAVSIRHPIPPIVLFILLTIAGIISFIWRST